MARSDPRRATIIGIAGVIVGVAMIAVVLLANNLGGDHTTTHSSRTKFDVGPAQASADAVKRDDTPLLFQDPATFSRPIYVQHIGDDANSGWTAFDAAIGSCVLTWHRESNNFTDCNGRQYSATGDGVHQYPWDIDNGELFVDLSPNATTTTTSTTTSGPAPTSSAPVVSS